MFHKAMRLHPFYPPFYEEQLANAYRTAGLYDEALEWHKKGLLRRNGFFQRINLAITYALLGRVEEARVLAAEVARIRPDYSISEHARRVEYTDPADVERELEAMRAAGFPEE